MSQFWTWCTTLAQALLAAGALWSSTCYNTFLIISLLAAFVVWSHHACSLASMMRKTVEREYLCNHSQLETTVCTHSLSGTWQPYRVLSIVKARDNWPHCALVTYSNASKWRWTWTWNWGQQMENSLHKQLNKAQNTLCNGNLIWPSIIMLQITILQKEESLIYTSSNCWIMPTGKWYYCDQFFLSPRLQPSKPISAILPESQILALTSLFYVIVMPRTFELHYFLNEGFYYFCGVFPKPRLF